MKKLAEMTLEELWQLFPIVLTEHDTAWKDIYLREEKRLKRALSDDRLLFRHIGSTAVEGIRAKPIVDILLEAPQDAEFGVLKAKLEKADYTCMSESAEKNRISFCRGYTANGFADEVFHLHLRRQGDCDEAYFCAYLKEFPQIAAQYEALKLSLWKPYEHDRDGYTAAKGDFVKAVTAKAKKYYKDKL